MVKYHASVFPCAVNGAREAGTCTEKRYKIRVICALCGPAGQGLGPANTAGYPAEGCADPLPYPLRRERAPVLHTAGRADPRLL